jgi:hypothetical protein
MLSTDIRMSTGQSLCPRCRDSGYHSWYLASGDCVNDAEREVKL